MYDLITIIRGVGSLGRRGGGRFLGFKDGSFLWFKVSSLGIGYKMGSLGIGYKMCFLGIRRVGSLGKRCVGSLGFK